MNGEGMSVPAQNLEAEENVLGAMMLGAVERVRATGIQAGDFYMESHGVIFDAACAMHDAGDPVDAITLAALLERQGNLDRAGGRVRVHELAKIVPATANADHYARIVMAAARLRYQDRLALLLREAAANGGVHEKPELVAELRQMLDAPHVGRDDWQPLSSVEMRSIVFLDPPLWQADAFHLLAGRKGVGKGTVLADVAARITRGELGEKRNILWIGSEDAAAVDIKPRLVAAGGDPARVFIYKGWLELPRDVAVIAAAIVRVGEVGLVVIDPVGNHILGKNSNAETEIREAIAPLNQLADEYETMVVGVRHLSEKEASRGVLAAILGSSAWVQVPRAVIAVVRDDEDEQVAHIQCVAGNRLPPGTPGRAFRIDGVLLDGLASEVTRATWIGDSGKNVEDLLASASDGRSRSAEARDAILDALEAAPDMQMESDALDSLVAAQTGLSAKTVANQRTQLRKAGLVKPVPQKDDDGTVERWLVVRTQAPRTS